MTVTLGLRYNTTDVKSLMSVDAPLKIVALEPHVSCNYRK